MEKTTKTSDAVEILRRRLLEDNPENQDLRREISLNARVAQLIYDLRKEHRLTQTQLAELVGTKQSAIARLEDNDYEGHSLSMLGRISEALGQRVEIDIVPAQSAAAISTKFHLRSLADLPGELVRIRSALGMTQQELGEKVGMSELEVQTHEAEGYRSISFARLTEVAEALGIDFDRLVVEIDRLFPTDDRTRTILSNPVDRLHHWWENCRSIVIVVTKSVAGNGSHISESESQSKGMTENRWVGQRDRSISLKVA
jgi:transcriptional regulator with XRE-family HTH domain